MRILHITPHLGGGVGKAISGLAIGGQTAGWGDSHRIFMLEPPEKQDHVKRCAQHGVEILCGDIEALRLALIWADVAVVNWWGHPAMARILRHFPQIPCTLLLWCHANGCACPFLSATLLHSFDHVLLTTLYSLENPEWDPAQREWMRGRAEIVYGMGDFAPLSVPPKETYQAGEVFTVGYVGTLNYGKLHPKFVEFCREVRRRLPQVRFQLVGDPSPALERDMQAAGMADRVEYTGFVPNASSWMRRFDLFGYPLHPDHYGTTENVLLEAMAAGLPIVALDQGVERSILSHEQTGLLTAGTAGAYGDAVARLAQDEDLRAKLGRAARLQASQTYDAQQNTARFHRVCVQASTQARQVHRFDWMGPQPWDWFLSGLPPVQAQAFAQMLEQLRSGCPTQLLQAKQAFQHLPPILRERRKGSVFHFAQVYPQDARLRTFSVFNDRSV